MSLPIIIMASLVGVFLVAIIIFLISQKKSDKDEADSNQEIINQLEIDIKDAKEDRESGVKADAVQPKESMTPPPPPEPAPIERPLEIQRDTERYQDEDESKPNYDNVVDYGSIFDSQPDESEELIKTEEADETDDQDDIAPSSIFATEEEDAAESFTLEQELETEEESESIGILDEDSLEDEEDEDEEIISTFLDEDEDEVDSILPEELFSADLAAAFQDDDEDEQELEIADVKEEAAPALSDSELDSLFGKPEEETPPSPPPTPVPEAEMDPEDVKRHEKSRRIARVIINDIRNYNPEKLAEGIKAGNIMKTLGVEVERGRQLYIKRVPPDIARSTNYYREALIKILSDGRSDLFGWKNEK